MGSPVARERGFMGEKKKVSGEIDHKNIAEVGPGKQATRKRERGEMKEQCQIGWVPKEGWSRKYGVK